MPEAAVTITQEDRYSQVRGRRPGAGISRDDHHGRLQAVSNNRAERPVISTGSGVHPKFSGTMCFSQHIVFQPVKRAIVVRRGREPADRREHRSV